MQLHEHFARRLENFDRCIRLLVAPISETELIRRTKSFNLVVTTGVFEHIRNRQTLDEMQRYVAETGCLAFHTLVREQIPKDADWMNLLPVHCAFHTNKSIQLLMEAWGYTSPVYDEYAKMWVMFRRDPHEIDQVTENLNSLLGWDYLHFKEGFVGYWP